jgi:hypothetical protein
MTLRSVRSLHFKGKGEGWGKIKKPRSREASIFIISLIL